MRPIDLNEVSGVVRADVDVCVIGAGPVGLAVARRLAERGARVALLERGGEIAAPQTDSHEVDFDARPYGGAGAGRAFGFGGTSSLWGGQLLPVTERELEGAAAADIPRWPIRFSEISGYYAVLNRWLSVDSGSFEVGQLRHHPLSTLDWTGFAPRYSKWLGFGQRHLGSAWRKDLHRARSLQIWLNARVTGFERHGQRITTVIARAAHAQINVAATQIVIAGGTIESTRMALSVFEPPDMRPHRPPALGRYLHDHLSLRIAKLVPATMTGVQMLFAPTFLNGTMRTLRMELADRVAESARMPPAYAHLVAEAPPRSGFAVLRDVLRGLQRQNMLQAWTSIKKVPAALPELCGLAYWRAVHARLAYPPRSALFLHVDFQQLPDIRNRIYLGSDRDADGCRRVRIDWDLYDDSARYAGVFEEQLSRLWKRNELKATAGLEFFSQNGTGIDLSNAYDIYHPAGTTRMSLDEASGCVDTNLRLFGTENIFIAGASVFPSLGAANPTYTAMALGLRLADHLAA